MVVCPFCGADETDRFTLERSRYLVFRCMFTPRVDPSWGEAELAEHLRAEYSPGGPGYFRSMCDRLHLYVAKGEGARLLTAPRRADAP